MDLGLGAFARMWTRLVRLAADEAGIPCIKGTAHLPNGYVPEVFK